MSRVFAKLPGAVRSTGKSGGRDGVGRLLSARRRTGPAAAIRFADSAAEWRLLLDPELAVGELFMDGRLIVTRGAIFDVLTIATRNIALAEQPRWLAAIQSWRGRLKRWSQRNCPESARRNVEHHYDIDPRIYDLFLDSDRLYSCAYFETPDQSLDESQLAKKRHIASKLLVEPGHRVLDIGSAGVVSRSISRRPATPRSLA